MTWKRMVFLAGFGLACAGCGITPEQRDDILRQTAEMLDAAAPYLPQPAAAVADLGGLALTAFLAYKGTKVGAKGVAAAARRMHPKKP